MNPETLKTAIEFVRSYEDMLDIAQGHPDIWEIYGPMLALPYMVMNDGRLDIIDKYRKVCIALCRTLFGEGYTIPEGEHLQ